MRAWREHDTCLQDPAIAANAVVTVVTISFYFIIYNENLFIIMFNLYI